MDWDTLGKKLTQFGEETKNSVQKLGETVQMNSRLSEANRTLQDQYAAIGKIVMDKFADDVPEGLEEAFAAVKEAKEAVETLEKQIRRKKGVVVCPECGKEVAAGEKFCGQCGTKLPEEQEAETEASEAKETPEEDIAKAAAGKAKEFLGNVADNAATFMKGVSTRLNEKKEEAAAAAEDLADEGEEAAEDLADEVIRAAQDMVEEPAEEVKEAAETAAEEMAEALQEVSAEDTEDAAPETETAADPTEDAE